jgi:hypothetical protein
VGFVPRATAEAEAQAGRLRILAVEAERTPAELQVAWRAGEEGRALKWFLKRLEDPLVLAELLP